MNLNLNEVGPPEPAAAAGPGPGPLSTGRPGPGRLRDRHVGGTGRHRAGGPAAAGCTGPTQGLTRTRFGPGPDSGSDGDSDSPSRLESSCGHSRPARAGVSPCRADAARSGPAAGASDSDRDSLPGWQWDSDQAQRLARAAAHWHALRPSETERLGFESPPAPHRAAGPSRRDGLTRTPA
jgi:hypothetical protein